MKLFRLTLPAACLILAACGSDNDDNMPITMPDDDMSMVDDPAPADPDPADPDPTDPTDPTPTTVELMITATNLTYAQPLSPIGVALHQEGQFWQLGTSASDALEVLAEGGDNSGLLALDVVQSQASAAAPLAPGQKTELTLTHDSLDGQKLSLISMMVNTNDGFTGLNALDVSAMAVGQTLTYTTHAYDAGTEANTEAQGTIPGPADGGTGFSAEREALNKVAMHPGVVGMDDGLTTSVLMSSHKFDNPLMTVTITRTK
ncbi:spondin domain-containing protein [Pseudoalteromonas sp. OOF1S-7]|uniref:spondin domain-containing protein n=1 Tax=Pseudoalteromonas sp. OOF1S-7 TaxID=2917757 RepID=UPI001EF3F76B|nr:spondin domain-containing protein [Pseudoalteromonas sp. OOF1S-7]MCG7536519.1 spondin domain-containing protein [Pseudoalteromonas sp. OOF1S-7]